MSVDWPWKPDDGWWIRMREFGVAVAMAGIGVGACWLPAQTS